MPWELTIFGDSSTSPRPLGSRDAVCEHLANRLPDIKLSPWPKEFSEHMKGRCGELGLPFTPWLGCSYQGSGFLIEFSCSDSETIVDMFADVRGDGDPLPALRTLCEGTDWVVVENATGQKVLDGGDGVSGWRRFKRWRNRAVAKITDRSGRA